MDIKGGGVLASTFFLLIWEHFSNKYVGAFVHIIGLCLAIGNLQIYFISEKIYLIFFNMYKCFVKERFFVFNVQIVSLKIPTLQDIKKCFVL